MGTIFGIIIIAAAVYGIYTVSKSNSTNDTTPNTGGNNYGGGSSSDASYNDSKASR